MPPQCFVLLCGFSRRAGIYLTLSAREILPQSCVCSFRATPRPPCPPLLCPKAERDLPRKIADKKAGYTPNKRRYLHKSAVQAHYLVPLTPEFLSAFRQGRVFFEHVPARFRKFDHSVLRKILAAHAAIAAPFVLHRLGIKVYGNESEFGKPAV